jgi:hypothetical protein
VGHGSRGGNHPEHMEQPAITCDGHFNPPYRLHLSWEPELQATKTFMGEFMLFAKKAFGTAAGLSRRRPVTASAILGPTQV